VAVGDTFLIAMVGGVGAGAHPKTVLFRLASLQWHYTSDDDMSEEGRAVAEIKWFSTAREAKLDKRWYETRASRSTHKTRLWDVSNQSYSVEVDEIVGGIDVVRTGE